MSGPGDEKRVFVADARRRFLLEEKLAIVAETETSPVSRVARKHGVSSGLLFRWRKIHGKSSATSRRMEPSWASFIPIALPAPLVPPAAPPGPGRDGAIEIVLAGNRRVVVGNDFDAAALKRVIAALEAS